MKGLIRDGVSRTVRLDTKTGSLKTVKYSDSKDNDGDGYHCSLRTAVNAFDIAAPIIFELTTPDTTKWIHLTVTGEANTGAYIEIFEDNGNASHYDIAAGSAVVEWNKQRNSSNTAGAVALSGGAITQATTDVQIANFAFGEARTYTLKQNTGYIIRATSYADNNEGSLSLDWFEHTNRS